MSDINDGGSAFPLSVAISPMGDEHIAYTGMSLRDYFAAKALAALIGSPYASQNWVRVHAAASAYQIADKMLTAREAT